LNYLKQLAGQTFVYGLGIVIPRLLNYIILTPFYTRIFSREEYGIITEFYAYVVFLMVFLTYGMETGYFRYSDKENNKDNVYLTTLTSLAVSSLLFISISLVFSAPISGWIGYATHPEYIAMVGMIVGLDAFTAIPFAKLRLDNRAFKYALIRIFEVLSNIGANWFFLYFCPRHCQSSEFIQSVYDPQIGIGYVFISNLISTFLKLALLSKEIIILKGRFESRMLKKLLIYSTPLLVAGLAGTINEALDRILLKYLIPAGDKPMEQLGIYGANMKLAVLMTLFVQMFRYAAEPFFFSRKEDHDAKVIYATVMKYFIFTGMVIFMIIMFYLDIFVLFIGRNFREGIAIVPVVLFANLLMGIFFNLSVWYKLTNKTIYGAYLVCGGAIITVLINLLFVKDFGYYASAWGHIASYTVMVIISFFVGQRHFNIPYETGKIILYIVLAFSFYAIYNILNNSVGNMKYALSTILLISYIVIFQFLEKGRIKAS
jgi:O-antigen/teichoic acid export membrane protein